MVIALVGYRQEVLERPAVVFGHHLQELHHQGVPRRQSDVYSVSEDPVETASSQAVQSIGHDAHEGASFISYLQLVGIERMVEQVGSVEDGLYEVTLNGLVALSGMSAK